MKCPETFSRRSQVEDHLFDDHNIDFGDDPSRYIEKIEDVDEEAPGKPTFLNQFSKE